MAINRLIGKAEVLDPLTMFHTVGQELENVFKYHKKDVALLGIENLAQKEKLTKAQIKKACVILNFDTFFADFLEKYQADYAQKKIECKAKYKEAKATFNKLKSVIPLLRNEFTDGFDILDDIIDFFGVDSEDEIFNHIREVATLYRSQTQTEINEVNLSAWIRRGELDFDKV
ncbi:MAG: hypothetical protein PHE45_03495, partial [Bacteroidales bacterium]|nr:hypothetical protein [Bacteroidales bacterium]